MTYIGAWVEHRRIYLAGDVLVTRMGLFNFEGDQAPIPTAADTNIALPKSYGIQITDLSQKVYIISDNVAVGWADQRGLAAEVIRDLFNAFEGKAPTMAEVATFFVSREETPDDSCTIIGWVVENNSALCFRWRSNDPSRFDSDTEFFEGSGNVFFNEIKKPTRESGENPSIKSALGKLANLLSYEMINGKNLQWQFGGAYQLVYYANGRFQHLTSATFVFFIVRELEEGRVEVGLVPRVLKSQYEDGILKIMAVSISKEGPSIPKIYYAYPIHIDRPDPAPGQESLSLSSDYDSILIDITSHKGTKGEIARTYLHDIPEPALIVTRDSEGNETLDIANNVFENLEKNLQEMNQGAGTFPTRDWLTKE